MTPPDSDDPAELARAYDGTGTAWQQGPARLVYDRLARVLVARTPVALAGRTVLDVGAGTGAATRSIRTAGGRAVAVDVSPGMLRADPNGSGAALVADARHLAVADRSVDGVVAAFSFNHLTDPVAGFREARRVCRPGSPVLVASYGADDDHPVKRVAEQALSEAGWEPAPWYDTLRTVALPRLASTDAMAAEARQAGLTGRVEAVVVELPDLDGDDLVAWRLGLAPVAPFLRRLAAADRNRVRARARALLGPDPEPLRRSIVLFAGIT